MNKKVAVALFLFVIASFASAGAETLLNGSLTNRYRFRTTGSQSDHDIDTILNLETPLSEDNPWYVTLSAAGHFDLGGTGANSVYRDAYDAFGNSAIGRLYYFYVERRETGPFQNIRLGRQQRYEFESLSFDGATLETKKVKGVSLFTYGGIPVHFYENQIGDNHGDYLVGGGMQVDPTSNFRGRLEYVHIKDKLSPALSPFGNQEDDLFASSVWWDVQESSTLSGRLSSYADQLKDVSVEFVTRKLDGRLQVRANYLRLLTEQQVRVTDLDAYFIAGSYEPYNQAGLKVSYGWNDHFIFDVGAQARILDDVSVASAFNHGYERYYLGLNTYDVLNNGLSLSAVGDYYHGRENTFQNNTFGGSFFATQELHDKMFKIHAGTAYYLYQYNLFTGSESQNVQTYFARLDIKFIKALEGRIGYDLEQNSLNTFHQIDTRLTWKF